MELKEVLLSLITCIVTLGTGWLTLQQMRLKAVADKTHLLVNNQYGVSLHVGATLSREKANRTKDPGDIKAAEYAEYLLAQHTKMQENADLKGVTAPGVPTTMP